MMEFVSRSVYNKRRKQYKKENLSLFDRFWKDEKKSEAWREKLLTKASKEKDKRKLKRILFHASIAGLVPVDMKREAIDQLIDLFTKKGVSDEKIDQRIENYNKNKIFKNGRRAEREALIFELNGKKIIVRTLTSASPRFEESFPELFTKERNCKCHEGSIKIARALGDEAKVVTGSHYVLSPKSTVLHSVVEANIGGEDYVLDYDSNTLWEKDDYYEFYHYEPFEKIAWKTIDEDTDDLLYLMNKDNDYCKLYLTSRDEAIALSKKMQEKENRQERCE